MTVALTTASTNLVYSGEGDYDFQFQVYDPDTDLEVTHIAADGVTETPLTYGVSEDPGYTAVIDQSYNGTVTVVDTGSTLGATGYLRIERNTTRTQLVDWLNAGPMNMDTLERCFDKLTMICQELQDSLDNFTMSLKNQGDWAAGTEYEIGDLVIYGGVYYVCMVAHTAGTWTASYWAEFFDPSHTHAAPAASAVSYDNGTSGLTADDVQEALNEVAALVTGQPERYRGLFDASGGVVPAWADLTAGDYGYISVYGVIDAVTFSVGDRIIYNGTTWDRILAIPGTGKNLFRNPNFILDATGQLDRGLTSSAIEIPLTSGWYRPTSSVYNDTPDYLCERSSLKGTRGSAGYYSIKAVAVTGAYHRGHMAQVLETSLTDLEGKTVTVSSDIQQGSLRVYAIPKTVGTRYNIVSLASIATYLLGTLTTTNMSVTGVFPAPPGTEDGYLMLLVDTKTDYTDDVTYACRFSYLKCELGDKPTAFITPSINEEIQNTEQYAESSLETGSWDADNFYTQAAASGWTGAENLILAKAVGTGTGPIGFSVKYRTAKRGTLITVGTKTPPVISSIAGSTMAITAAAVNRTVSAIYTNRNSFQLKNMSGVTLTDQSQVGYHWYVLYELL